MNHHMQHTLALITTMALAATAAQGQVSLNYEGAVTMNVGDSQLAPYYIMAGRGGTVTQRNGALLSGSLSHDVDTTRRLSWGAGVELWTGYAASADYKQWDPAAGQFAITEQHPARLWVQQLYASLKWRGTLTHLGAKRPDSPVVNASLSSGDLGRSDNSRPPVGIETGFVNYQNIPFTHGWVQIEGRLGYYRMPGADDWLRNHYSYYNSFVTTNVWLNYKRAHLRTNPTKPVVFTLGMQAACQFGGTQRTYVHGQMTETSKSKTDLKAFFRTLVPGSGGGNGGQYVEGNHVGTWDLLLEWKQSPEHLLRAYYESPWEDGSGIGKLNGFDGLWGLEYRNTGKPALIDAVVLEYIDLTNQSGYIHWSADDFPDSPITQANGGKSATGADDYYNNYFYNGYQVLGQSIGSPFVKSLIYNRDGYMRYTDNLLRGFHLGLRGTLSSQVAYRTLLSYRRAWGTPYVPRAQGQSSTSWLAEAVVTPKWLPGLRLTAQFALDHGRLLGNNVGGLISIAYSGNFSLSK